MARHRGYDELMAAFTIFGKYPHEYHLSRGDYEIYSGPDPKVVSDEDKIALEKLGWLPHATYDCFYLFV